MLPNRTQLPARNSSTAISLTIGLLSQLSEASGNGKSNTVSHPFSAKAIVCALSGLANSLHRKTGATVSSNWINCVSIGVLLFASTHKSVTVQILLILSPQLVVVAERFSDNWKSQTTSVSDRTIVSNTRNCPLIVNPVNNFGGWIGAISGLEKSSSQLILTVELVTVWNRLGRSIFNVSTRRMVLPKSSVFAQVIKKSDWLLQRVSLLIIAVVSICASDCPQGLTTLGIGKEDKICSKSKSQAVKIYVWIGSINWKSSWFSVSILSICVLQVCWLPDSSITSNSTWIPPFISQQSKDTLFEKSLKMMVSERASIWVPILQTLLLINNWEIPQLSVLLLFNSAAVKLSVPSSPNRIVISSLQLAMGSVVSLTVKCR